MTRKALGKGLEAIFGTLGSELVNPATGQSLHEIEVAKISPNPFQPRRDFKEAEILELAESIREKGLLQPVLLRKHGESYQLVAGERRLRALQTLGKTHIAAQVREKVSDRDMMELALIENLQRVQLNPIEEALALDRLVAECGVTHEELAQKLGKSRSAITNTLRLLKLETDVRELIRMGQLTAGHGRALLQTPPGQQLRLARKMVDGQMNVRRAERAGFKKEPRGEDKRDRAGSPHTRAFLDKLRYLLGTKVVLKGTENRGILEIHYLHTRDLENLGDLLQRGHESQSPLG
jgi:ParB family chromosome partitioning protein